MKITTSQFETWSNPGANATAKRTHEIIQNALNQTGLFRGPIETYLQGSYRNSTNIRGDSDVDIVLQLNQTFSHERSLLSPEDLKKHEETYSPATYSFEQFHNHAVAALKNAFGAQFVEVGNKSIKILPGSSGRLVADVVPCLEHRHYTYFDSPHNDDCYHAGISLKHGVTGPQIINFPKIHARRGEAKNVQTSGKYKNAVRVLKNWKKHLADASRLDPDTAPSYFIECMVFNVPDEYFVGSGEQLAISVLLYLIKNFNEGWLCQHGVHRLFGEGSTQWSVADAKRYLDSLVLST